MKTGIVTVLLLISCNIKIKLNCHKKWRTSYCQIAYLSYGNLFKDIKVSVKVLQRAKASKEKHKKDQNLGTFDTNLVCNLDEKWTIPTIPSLPLIVRSL